MVGIGEGHNIFALGNFSCQFQRSFYNVGSSGSAELGAILKPPRLQYYFIESIEKFLFSRGVQVE